MARRSGTTIHNLGGIRVSSNFFDPLGSTFDVTPTITARSSNSFTIEGSLLETGDVFAVAILQTDTPPTTPAQIIAGTNGDDSSARGTGSQLDITSFSFDITGNDLVGNQAFDIYIVGRFPQGT